MLDGLDPDGGLQHKGKMAECSTHHTNFDNYEFFIRWVPSVSLKPEMMAGLFLLSTGRHLCIPQLSRKAEIEESHGKTVVLDPNHPLQPIPRSVSNPGDAYKGDFYPWCDDRLTILSPRHTTYTIEDNTGGDSDISRRHTTGTIQVILYVLYELQSRPARIHAPPVALQQLGVPNWKSATVEGLTWEGTAEENTKESCVCCS